MRAALLASILLPASLLVSVVGCRAQRTRAAAPAPGPGRLVTFSGACDASGAVALDDRHFAVADDEDNVLRVYDGLAGGPPLHAIDLSDELPIRKKKKKKGKKRAAATTPEGPEKKARETDLEAATRLGDEAFWLTSHGRTSTGKADPARFLLFATSLPRAGRPTAVVGTPYVHLIDDLLAAEALRPFDLAAAAARPPKAPGGLALEGLTATPDGRGMYVGFRNPIPQGRALVVKIENPRAVMSGARAALGPPVRLDLGGRGVRSLSWWRGRYLVAAGAHDDERDARLFVWDGRGAARPVTELELAGLNPEAFFTPEDREELMLLSDDGAREIAGRPCKELERPADKRFRGLWVRLAAGSASP